jgi:hypothetical protein
MTPCKRPVGEGVSVPKTASEVAGRELMLSYTRHPELDFTRFVSAGFTSIDNWLMTGANYVKEGMTNREFYDRRQQTNLFANDEIGMILNRSDSVNSHATSRSVEAGSV